MTNKMTITAKRYIEIYAKSKATENVEDILTAFLADFGCESFSEIEQFNEVYGYIPEPLFNKECFEALKENSFFDVLEYRPVEEQNWNETWESNYPSVTIDGRCLIRAPFHAPQPDMEFEIVIEPKMSFGTAHHETTSSMISMILEEDLNGKSVLDMGAGTGVLAILAAKKGAQKITSIDCDNWSYLNHIENNNRNEVPFIEVKLGDAQLLGTDTYDVIFANINRNILMADLPAYVKVLNLGGMIFLSGFYEIEDLEIIKNRCAELHLAFEKSKSKNNWVAAKFIKI